MQSSLISGSLRPCRPGEMHSHVRHWQDQLLEIQSDCPEHIVPNDLGPIPVVRVAHAYPCAPSLAGEGADDPMEDSKPAAFFG
jgi:hypothetical protein